MDTAKWTLKVLAAVGATTVLVWLVSCAILLFLLGLGLDGVIGD
jgi:hypothetical protein